MIAALLSLAMVAVIVPGISQAEDSAADLNAQIAALQAQLASLTAQLGGTTTTTTTGSSVAACQGVTFTRNLTIGSTGTDVKCLQALLNQDPTTQVATTGAGAPGFESMYFGAKTKAAVIAFQNKYASEVLTPVNLTVGTGFVGAATRAKLNAMVAGGVIVVGTLPAGCTSTSGYSTVTGQPCSSTSTLPAGCTTTSGYSPTTGLPCSGTATTTTAGTEGQITVSWNPTPAAGTKIYEGASKTAILGLLIKATGSDMKVERAKLNFGTARISDLISTIYVYDGDTELVSKDVTYKTDGTGSLYKESDGTYSMTITGINATVAKASSKALIIKADALSAISRDYTLPYTVTTTVPANSVRAVDTLGLNQYDPSAALSTTRTWIAARTEAAVASLTLSRDANTPLSRNVGTGTDGEVDGVTLLTFDIKALKDDVKVTDLKNFTFASSTAGLFPTTAYLYDGDSLLASGTVVQDGAARTVDFTDLTINVSKDTTKVLTLKGDFDAAASTTAEMRVSLTANATNVVAENSLGSTLAAAYLTGTVTSYTTNVAIAVPVFTLTGTPTGVKTAATEIASSTFVGTFNINVKAVGGDIMMAETGAFIVAAVKNNDTTSTTTATSTYDKPSGVTASSTDYIIPEDTTVTFVVKGTISGFAYQGAADYYDLRVESIRWRGAAGSGGSLTLNQTTYTFTDDPYKTDKAYMP